jgi:DNA-binding response OmpR family regulator
MQATLVSEGRPRVLLIEDDTELRSLLTKELGYRGCDVIEAGTGSAAIDYVIFSLIHEHVRDRPALLIIAHDGLSESGS